MQNIDQVLSKQVKRKKTPGVRYIIFNETSLIHAFQDGLANVKNQRPVNQQTTFNAFSVTKTFTGLAILQLAEKGKLSIDKSAKKYLPDFPYTEEITIRQLLSHSAGVPNPNPMSWIHLESEHQSFDRDAFFKPLFKKYHRTKFSPNEKFSYSNPGYVLLGQLIEKVSGQSYETYIRENILLPLAIKPSDLNFGVSDKNRSFFLHNKSMERI